MAVTRTLIDRIRALNDIESSLVEFGPELQAGLEETFADVLEEGEVVPDFAFFQELVLRKLRRLVEALSQAEALVSEVRLEGKNRQARRDELAKEIRGLLRTIRDTCQTAYGRERGDSVIGIKGRITAVPVDLVTQAEIVLKLLEEIDLLPEPAGEAQAAIFQRDPEPWAEMLRDPVPALDVAIEQAIESQKRLEGAQGKRSHALKSFNTFFVDAAGFLENLYRLAGIDDAKTRGFRPSKQDPGLTLRQSKLKRAISQGHKNAAKNRQHAKPPGADG